MYMNAIKEYCSYISDIELSDHYKSKQKFRTNSSPLTWLKTVQIELWIEESHYLTSVKGEILQNATNYIIIDCAYLFFAKLCALQESWFENYSFLVWLWQPAWYSLRENQLFKLR